jgi:branched-chain amino acid transport system ATP-binding protein
VEYAGSAALRGVDLHIAPGELVTVIGANGAGKTTLLRAVSGIVPHRGSIRFEGEDLRGLEPDRIVRRGIVHVPEGRMVLSRMSVRENLLLGAFTRRGDPTVPADLDNILAMFPRLQERLGQLAGSLSGGEQQMLAIGRGLMGRPRLLMLDEPSLGIAPIIVAQIFTILADIRRRGVTVLLVEQNAVKALAAADRGYALDLGRVSAAGTAAELMNDDRVRRAYLGV